MNMNNPKSIGAFELIITIKQYDGDGGVRHVIHQETQRRYFRNLENAENERKPSKNTTYEIRRLPDYSGPVEDDWDNEVTGG